MLPDATILELERLRRRLRDLEETQHPPSFESEARQSGVDHFAPTTRALLEAGESLARVGAFRWDARTNELHTSPGLGRILPAASISDLEHTLALVHPDDRQRAKRLVKLVLAGHEAQPVELRLLRPHEGTAHLVVQATPELDVRGELSSISGAVMDITEQKEIESRLLQVQKLEAVGTLASGVAHDFNNFLQVVGGHSELMRLDPALSDRSRESLSAIDAALLRCRGLIQQLLAFGRRNVSNPGLNDARTLLEGALSLVGRLIGSDVVLEVDMQSGAFPVRVDPVEFEQVVVNFAVNARAAMPEGGQLIVRLSRMTLDGDEARPLGLSPGSFCCLSVTDTGTGMSEEVRERVFEPFFTTKPSGQGTGLGLSTVHGIVRRARGAVRVTSEPGKGSTFHVYLPLALGEDPSAVLTALDPDARGGTETILVVDDSDQVRTLIRNQLESAGYQVLVASDAEGAIGASRAHPGGIALLLTDLMLPGMSGPDLELELRKRHPKLRTLLMSGYTERLVPRRASLSRHTIALHKPFSMKELTRAVREHLDADPGETTQV